MENTEIIKELRDRHFAFDATGNHKTAQLFKEAADLIEELQDKPWVESVQVDKLDQQIDALQGTIEQIRWERDMAMQQLDEHGIPFGGKADDVVKVCRCKDCKHHEVFKNGVNGWCNEHERPTDVTYFCADGERKQEQ